MQGTITLGPLELLALAALPLSAISKTLKERLRAWFGGGNQKTDT